MKKTALFIFPVLVLMLYSCNKPESKFEALFNGSNFDGWETYIGVPDHSINNIHGLSKNEEGLYTQPIGTNKDPLNVFSITEIDGEPALHISGQVYGSFSTLAEHENYHLRLEVKWGDKKWAPREDKARNSGILYHGVGKFGKGLEVWKISHECQVMENMFGDSYRMGDTYCNITAKANDNGGYIFDPQAPSITFGTGLPAGKICSKNILNEKPHGEWNVIEVLCLGDVSVHIINGTVNMVNTKSHLMVNGNEIALTKGVIQLQSEGAEVYYRRMEIRSINEIPKSYLQ
ncbi:hypothetical protein AwDysgo_08690 [Bacteroidales bacterium]|nr:hypothetical protein AwDysgo_08690 [Bacteroidales bacterium]